MASCCLPIPGDPIIGFLRQGQGLQIHTTTCSVALKSRNTEQQNWIHVGWEPDPGQHFDVRIKVTALNVRGVLGRVATGISQAGANIENVSMDGENLGMYTVLHFLVQVSDRLHLATLMRGLRRMTDVVRIVRDQE